MEQENQRLARAALTRLIEPGDLLGAALVDVTGPEEALELMCDDSRKPTAALQQSVSDRLGDAATTRREVRLETGFQRWRTRVPDLAPQRDLDTLRRVGGGFLGPEDPDWPEAVNGLDLARPLGLWWRGQVSPAVGLARPRVAVVGSRDASEYGIRATHELIAPLMERDCQIVSGGAYGIDAAAHRAALGATARGEAPGVRGAPTIAMMAGGLDRFYPAGNESLLREVARTGLLLSEVPPGSSPTRWRFLQRNRVIAALSTLTVVVEARWRSGALATARRAAELGRTVAAVPGSIFSANSAGCHRLMHEVGALPVVSGGDLLELLSLEHSHVSTPHGGMSGRQYDDLDVPDRLLFDALPLRQLTTVDQLCRVAGLSLGAVLSGLSRLRACGLATEADGQWRRSAAK
ncbi:DNA-processing protein DprA [Zhihengliuella flava]|uniref:DNA processing protein n=1 Tax=Zhihengliuella flava TaxID=1285193 RepID=A0A931GEG2_9MICC|nr:DNA-processing protein DprA [Zhihengliuella flava]MBG6083492.1 DNA processing protein [Zhihengliuella flava]